MGIIETDEFVDGCLRLRGTAKALDIAEISYQNKAFMKKVSKFMEEMCAQFSLLENRDQRRDTTMTAASRASGKSATSRAGNDPGCRVTISRCYSSKTSDGKRSID